ncbi:MAG: winged helix-turn-helix transcriptional regulator [Leptolyngbya sp. SIO3F4]|nr:winged helix-turn-helix transcriptional regulator [Leptolyngbya sp. SIO3F4]
MDQLPVVASFHALADPIRIKVIGLLKNGEYCVSEICQNLDVSQARLSFHLKALKDADLVTARRQGQHIYYSLNKVQFDYLEGFLSEY